MYMFVGEKHSTRWIRKRLNGEKRGGKKEEKFNQGESV